MREILMYVYIYGHELEIYAYDVFNMFLNPLCFIGLGTYFLTRRGISPKKAAGVLVLLTLAVLVGARATRVLLGLKQYHESGMNPFSLAPGGFTMFGGFFLAVPVVVWISKRLKLSVWSFLDAVTPGWALGIMFNKIGCFLSGCCFGIPTNLPIGVVFPQESIVWEYYHTGGLHLIDPVHVHPVQLYESAVGLAGFLLVVWLLRRSKQEGLPFAVFAVMYSSSRLILHFFRALPPSIGFSPLALGGMYALVVACAVWALVNRLRQRTIDEGMKRTG